MCWKNVVSRFEEYAAQKPYMNNYSYARSMRIFADTAEKMGISSEQVENIPLVRLQDILPEGVRAAKRGCKQSMTELLDLAVSSPSHKDLVLTLGSCRLEDVRDVKVGEKHLVELTEAQFKRFQKVFRATFAIHS